MERIKRLLLKAFYDNREGKTFIHTTKQMKNITRVTSIGVPAILGLGLSWVCLRIISNEKRLRTRKLELEIQIDVKAIKNL